MLLLPLPFVALARARVMRLWLWLWLFGYRGHDHMLIGICPSCKVCLTLLEPLMKDLVSTRVGMMKRSGVESTCGQRGCCPCLLLLWLLVLRIAQCLLWYRMILTLRKIRMVSGRVGLLIWR